MIFVLDNGLQYDENSLIFVVAGPGFEAWLTGPFSEWHKQHNKNVFTIVATAPTMEFRDLNGQRLGETSDEFWKETRHYLGPGGPGGEGRFSDPPPLPVGAK